MGVTTEPPTSKKHIKERKRNYPFASRNSHLNGMVHNDNDGK